MPIFNASALLAQLGPNPSGNKTDAVLRAVISALEQVSLGANEDADFWPDPFGCKPKPTDLTAADIVGFEESVQDIVIEMLVAGENVTLTIDRATNRITIDASGSGGGDVTQAELDAVEDASILADADLDTRVDVLEAAAATFNSDVRAQVEAELVAGSGITITPSGAGATRQLTLAATGGGTPAEVLITETVLAGAAASVQFAAIAATYRDLRVVVRGRGSKAALFTDVWMRFNADATANYDWELGQHFGVSNAAQQSIGTNQIVVGDIPANTATAGIASAIDVRIFDYRGTTFQKTAVANGSLKTSTAANATARQQTAGFWRSTAAITQIDVMPDTGNFVAGTVISLYGIL